MLARPGEQPAIRDLGVAIKGDALQRHVAILYRSEAGQLRLSHQAWHMRLVDEPYDDTYYTGSAHIDSTNQEVLALWLEDLPRANLRVPYGINAVGIRIDPATKQLLPVQIGRGLTCATYILRVFSEFGHELLRQDAWPAREDDQVWQAQIIAMLEERGCEPEHIAAMRKDVGSARFRPEEVAAGVVNAPPALTFDAADALATEILRDLGI